MVLDFIHSFVKNFAMIVSKVSLIFFLFNRIAHFGSLCSFCQRWINVIFIFYAPFANGLELWFFFFLLNVKFLHVLSFNHSLNPILPLNHVGFLPLDKHKSWILHRIWLLYVCDWLNWYLQNEWWWNYGLSIRHTRVR